MNKKYDRPSLEEHYKIGQEIRIATRVLVRLGKIFPKENTISTTANTSLNKLDKVRHQLDNILTFDFGKLAETGDINLLDFYYGNELAAVPDFDRLESNYRTSSLIRSPIRRR